MSSLSTDNSSSTVQRPVRRSAAGTARARRRLDLLVAAGLALVAGGVGAVAVASRAGGTGSGAPSPARLQAAVSKDTPKPILALPAAGSSPRSSARATGAQAVADAQAASDALPRRATSLLGAGASAGT